MFENMVDLMFKDEYDFYVFDTAPTANARRLPGMSKVYSLWVDKMLKSREEAKSLRELLSCTKKKKSDPLLDDLLAFKNRMGKAADLLKDDALTAFFFSFSGIVKKSSPHHLFFTVRHVMEIECRLFHERQHSG